MRNLLTIKCRNPNCTNTFNLFPSEIGRKLYCCNKCYSEYHWSVTPLFEKSCLNPICKNIIKRKFKTKLNRVKYCCTKCRKDHKKWVKDNSTIQSNCKYCKNIIIHKREPCGKLVPRKTCDKCAKDVLGKIVKEKIQNRIKIEGPYPKWKKWYGSFVKKSTYGKSKLEDKVFECLQIKNKEKIERWYPISGLFVDFYIPNKNLVIECLGDYWHMNPHRFDPLDFNKSTKRTAKEQWKKDETRRLFLQSQGYKIVELWESEINLGDYTKLDIYI